MVMTREDFEVRLGASEGLVSVTDVDVIAAAWGERRVSSRKRGMDLRSYPASVTAMRSLWLLWYDDIAGSRKEYVVIAKKKAQARIDAALGRTSNDPETVARDSGTAMSQGEIDALLTERDALRAARRFADADKIRDYLVAKGVQVADQKVSA